MPSNKKVDPPKGQDLAIEAELTPYVADNAKPFDLSEFEDVPLDDPEEIKTPHKALDPKNLKRNMGFSQLHNNVAGDEAAQQKLLNNSYYDLRIDIVEYKQFVIEAIERLSILEQGTDRFDALTRELRNIHIDTVITSEIKFKDQFSSKSQSKKIAGLNDKIGRISAVADKVVAHYNHLHPTEGSKFAHKNNTLLNRILDKFLSFVSKIKTKLGFTDHLKREIVSDIKGMQAKHPPLAKLR